MKKLKKLKLKSCDFTLLNPEEQSQIVGGAEPIICKLGQKIYSCASFEASCEKGFTYECGLGDITCGLEFTLRPYK